MFTGLVQAVGVVEEIERRGGGARLVIGARGWGHRAVAGESVSVGGVCLTVVEGVGAEGVMRFDVVGETLARTTLGGLAAGSRVNLERSLRADDLMGGHVVQGHVDAVGRVARVERGEGDWRVEFEMPEADDDPMQYVVEKGSVAVEGVSLTVAGVDAPARRFGVALVPTTLAATTLGGLEEDGRVNVETDVMARTVVHWLRHYGGAGSGGGSG